MNRVRLHGSHKPLWARRQQNRPLRNFIARAFHVVAFSATFFGLIMLAVFFGRLGLDSYRWLRTTPVMIEDRKAELEAKLGAIDSEVAGIDAFMNDELAAAADDAEKEQIRKEYAKIKTQTQAEAELTRKEIANQLEEYRQRDQRPLALLGFFFTERPSNLPEAAGIRPALLGSLFLAFLTIIFSVPLGVGAAVYLEEYRSTGWLSRIIQVNINNLAGVPAVLYGIIGAFIFVDTIFRPLENQYPEIAARNLLGGGLTLALLTLPIIIVSAQEAIRAVPVSIRHAALALGATRWQTIWHHVLPGALPGIFTGTILALSRALGEAAALVMFGALLFVSQDPTLFSRFTVLPMQIFGWTDRPQEAWRYNAALASVVLIVLLLSLNAMAIYLRNRAQRFRE